MQLELVLKTELRDEEGNLVKKRTIKSKSFVQNFLAFLFEIFRAGETTTKTTAVGTAYLAPSAGTLTDVTGAAKSILTGFDLSGGVTPTYPVCRLDAPDGEDGFGIVVGTDDGTLLPLAPDNTNLGSKISHGVADGQLSHEVCSLLNFTVSPPDVSFDVRRIFVNNAAAINVWELGIIARINLANATNAAFLIVRDILAAADSVGTGYSYTVTYTFKTTV